jgi:6-pyruvoyltetrahydropterin/6-carboxytetrahydropterin synthase
MYEIETEREFSAAHQLKNYKGNCSFLHGHNWTVQVTVRAKKLDKIGIAVDFRKLKAELDTVIQDFDHKNLSGLEIFKGGNPTSEHLAKIIYDKLSAKLNTPGARVHKVSVSESRSSRASYFEE